MSQSQARRQVIALLTYLAAYFPGGLTTLRFGGQMGKSSLLLQRPVQVRSDDPVFVLVSALRGAGSVLPF